MTIDSGDFNPGDDYDLMFLSAFGEDDELLDTDVVFWGDSGLASDPPVRASVSSARGIRTITFVGGSPEFENSVFYDNITVPEPDRSLLAGVAIALLAVLRGYREARRSTRRLRCT